MEAESQHIYCISGLGADERVFEQMQITNCKLINLPFLKPVKNETLAAYASRMFKLINEEEPILLGVSFGGMLAIEMAKQFPVKMIILVSAVKTYRELPLWMRLSGKFRLHKIIPLKTNALTEKADDRRMGIQNERDKFMVEQFRQSADRIQVDWAIDKILNWKNNTLPKNMYHIHGSSDRMFPIKNINATHIIEGGTHMMILNRTEEVSSCVEEILRKVTGY